ncbi:MAG TPA: histidine kinase, partial [Cellvibrionaceae bacterium]
FSRGDGSWLQQGFIKAPETGINDRFGHRVALSHDGQILASSAYREASGDTGVDGDITNKTEPAAGAVYLY